LETFSASPPADACSLLVGDWEEVPPPHPWGHDHCEFCEAKLESAGGDGRARDPSALTEGYASTGPGNSQ
jgi:hypothetical protein